MKESIEEEGRAGEIKSSVDESEHRPTFSLIVPTLGRTKEIGALFESIVASHVNDLEVIVVDQNQDASLDDICLRYSKKFSLNHLKVEFKGLSRARNYGARFASGKYLNFPDDDCVLLPDTLRLAQELLESMNLKVLAGMSVDELGRDSTTRFVRDERFLTLWNLWVRHIEFATFIDREAFLRIGGFNERFGVGSTYGADEGPELLIRLLPTLASRQAYYSHRLRFTHPDKRRDYSAKGIERAFLYARGRGAFYLTVFGEAHSAGHLCWYLHDPKHPRHDKTLAREVGEPIKDVYVKIDSAVGEILERVGPDTTAFVFLSHGIGPHYSGSEFLDDILFRLEGGTSSASREWLGVLLRAIWIRLPHGIRKPLMPLRDPANHTLIENNKTQRKYFEVANNYKTGAVRINLAGRERDGMVQPGVEYDALCKQLTEDLLTLPTRQLGNRW